MEVLAHYIIECLQLMALRGATTMEVTQQAYDDYVACRGEQGAKEAGKMRVEGKTYVVKDGDVLLFRFNV